MPLEIGAVAPDFTLKDQNNQPVTLSDFRGRRNVLLVFFPLAFTGTCAGELRRIRDDLPSFQNDTSEVLTVSVGAPPSHKMWANEHAYLFPILSDFWPHGAVAQAYDVFNDRAGVANRGTFVVDRAGAIRFAEMNGPGQPRDSAVWASALDALAIPDR